MLIRIQKKDAAYLYQLLESYEGLTNHTTMPAAEGTLYREIRLHKSPEQNEALRRMLQNVSQEIELVIISED